ncbi:MAG: AraC family transcriptional regulator [Pseudomonadota bacterium]
MDYVDNDLLERVDNPGRIIDVVGGKDDAVSFAVDAHAESAASGIAVYRTKEQFEELTHHPWDRYLVVLPTRVGNPIVKLGGETSRDRGARAGELTIVTPHHDGHWSVDDGDPFETIKVELPVELVQQTAQAAFGDRAEFDALLDVHGMIDPVAATLIRAIDTELSHADALSSLYLDSAIQTLTLHLLRNHSTGPDQAAPRRTSIPPKLTQVVLEYIEDNLAEDVSLEQIAGIAEMSPFHFSRAFKVAMGETPHRYVLRRRVERCRALLERSQMTLAHIAYACGFSSQSHMTAVFRRETGVTPGRLRRESLQGRR